MVGYLIVLGFAFLARSALSLFQVPFVTSAQRTVWSWPAFAIFLAAFATAVFFATRARLPTPAETLRARTSLALAIFIGATVGCLTIWSDWMSPIAAARGVPSVHVRGLAAGPFYAYGAILITVVFHFLPMAVTAWLAGRLRTPTARHLLLAMATLLVAFSEDASFFLANRHLVGLDSARHALSVVANATEAILIYRCGLLAGLAQRGSTYLLWHLLWPNLTPS